MEAPSIFMAAYLLMVGDATPERSNISDIRILETSSNCSDLSNSLMSSTHESTTSVLYTFIMLRFKSNISRRKR